MGNMAFQPIPVPQRQPQHNDDLILTLALTSHHLMSVSALPKELRLQIWALAYHTQPRRYVTLQTAPHATTHAETTFCPRTSPSPPPTTAHICRESRTETLFQARKAGHLIHLPSPLSPDNDNNNHHHHHHVPQPFFFRFGTDALLYDSTHPASIPAPAEAHFDSSPETGFLPHFLHAAGGQDARALTALALTDVHALRTDGSVSNCLRDFPALMHLLFVADAADVADADAREAFVRTAVRVVGLFEFDLSTHHPGVALRRDRGVEWDIAVRRRGAGGEGEGGRWRVEFEVVPAREWRNWATPEDDWGMAFCPTRPEVYWRVDGDGDG